ncbi:MAG: hypothetical protein A2275_03300 [Bacteroidetes bacterium RIFOXYA12_FULL_35_11]|nr:MAG: hypothetical protein A2X01_08810 [Bacteroidetes bacterium GWF2_35_48]OFY72563.1 MAG: hypothetical protein A2275_03300 [Bacteroidetes bacterium RIFOXYA12_FULL_35_11]OFY97273.1 MAG: hypothetical protein A2309_10980 [Bacteroidetes bacterium RIFOXYB2_FULL_35_7]OFZ02327.1 MAG: hypothetical protein A2491_09720 [Bacteroidetes bacterium RIFOXYC12_FULL_35_7]HBX52509.1 hypothetical protein [Bacteroidales bacterium]
MKTLKLIPFLFFLVSISFAGNDTDWQLSKSEKGVQVYFKKIQCDLKSDPAYMDPHQELVVFKLVNTGNKKVTVSWTFEIWFGANCRSCNLKNEQGNPYSHSFELNPGQTIEGNCESPQKSGLMLFSSFYKKDPSKNNPMTKFELKGFSVK